MLDPSRTNSSPRSFEKRARSLRAAPDGQLPSLRQSRVNSRRQAKGPEMGQQETSGNQRRKSLRSIRNASARMIFLDHEAARHLQDSDSSLNMSSLALDAPPTHNTLKNGSTGTMNTSRGSLVSDSSLSVNESKYVSPSPSRNFTETVSARFSPRRPSKVAEIRQEMNKSFSSLGQNDSTATTTSIQVIATDPLMKASRTQDRGEKKKTNKPPSRSPRAMKKISRSKSSSHSPLETIWRRNGGPPKRSKSDQTCLRNGTKSKNPSHSPRKKILRSKSSNHSPSEMVWRRNVSQLKRSKSDQTCLRNGVRSRNGNKDTESRKRGRSIRTMLRNKRKLEKELDTNDVFHFVLHKAQLPSQTKRLGGKEAVAVQSEGESSDSRKHLPKSRLSLSRFLLMKQNSERLVTEKIAQGLNDAESETWKSASQDLSKSLPQLELTPRMNHSLTVENEGEEVQEDDDIEDGESAIQSAPGASQGSCALDMGGWEQDIITVDGTTDVECSKSAAPSVESVHEFAIVDHCGRRGKYTGMVSLTTQLPTGAGRLHYTQEDLVLEGDFYHGHWMGYGRAVDFRTFEDYTGSFQGILRHGQGETYFPDGRVFVGSYIRGAPQYGKMVYPDGSTYVGEWSPNGQRHGQGIYRLPQDRAVYIGRFVDDKVEKPEGTMNALQDK